MQSNCSAYELLFCETSTGKQLTSATELRDVQWDTWTCTLGNVITFLRMINLLHQLHVLKQASRTLQIHLSFIIYPTQRIIRIIRNKKKQKSKK